MAGRIAPAAQPLTRLGLQIPNFTYPGVADARRFWEAMRGFGSVRAVAASRKAPADQHGEERAGVKAKPGVAILTLSDEEYRASLATPEGVGHLPGQVAQRSLSKIYLAAISALCMNI